MAPQTSDGSPTFSNAVNDFREARRKAALENIIGPILGKKTDLLSYDLVREKLRAIESSRHTLGDIPLNKIVGSVNRYTDFSRSFLPLLESDKDRWARVRQGVEALHGLPPIEVYKLGESYFVLDGHHRVSVARELGITTIEGYIIPVYTRVPLAPDDSPDDLIVKAEYTDFLTRTRMDELRSDANLLVTAPGQYQKLLEHIAVHQYFMGEKRGAEVSEEEAIVDWYDIVYQPIAQLIRARNLLRDFPGRTETDLYLWIMDYRAELSGGSGMGWEVPPEKAAADLSARFSPNRRFPRLMKRISSIVIPETLDPGPPPGAWRSEHQFPRRGDHLFDDLMVAVQGGNKGRAAVKMAIEVAQREEARLTGLHVVSTEAEKESPEVKAIKESFVQRCSEAGIFGRLLVEVGRASHLVCQRSPWVDLSIFTLAHPPPQQFLKRLNSGTRMLIRRCNSPLLAVPDAPYRLDSALLAFGPGRRAEEALFVATYIAGSWQIPLTVLMVNGRQKQSIHLSGHGAASPTPVERARSYLESNGIQATYIEESGDSARAILLNAEAHNANFLIMGGYESGPLRESVFGSTLDHVLRSTRRPVLICR
jgi:nucleotide-binding universal stress UspA family protein